MAESTGNKDPDFLKKAKETHRVHSANCREYKDWNISKTAKALGRSIGSISEDLLIVRWWKVFPVKIEKMRYAKDCLEWIREKANEQELEEI